MVVEIAAVAGTVMVVEISARVMVVRMSSLIVWDATVGFGIHAASAVADDMTWGVTVETYRTLIFSAPCLCPPG